MNGKRWLEIFEAVFLHVLVSYIIIRCACVHVIPWKLQRLSITKCFSTFVLMFVFNFFSSKAAKFLVYGYEISLIVSNNFCLCICINIDTGWLFLVYVYALMRDSWEFFMLCLFNFFFFIFTRFVVVFVVLYVAIFK